jgi:hypothetical protein
VTRPEVSSAGKIVVGVPAGRVAGAAVGVLADFAVGAAAAALVVAELVEELGPLFAGAALDAVVVTVAAGLLDVVAGAVGDWRTGVGVVAPPHAVSVATPRPPSNRSAARRLIAWARTSERAMSPVSFRVIPRIRHPLAGRAGNVSNTRRGCVTPHIIQWRVYGGAAWPQ